MSHDDSPERLRQRIRMLTTKARHLENELRLERQETAKAKNDFFDIYFNLESIIEERTKALAQSENLFRKMAEAINEVYWMASAGFDRFHFVSPSFSELWRLPSETLYDNPDIWLERLHPEDLGLVRANREKLKQGLPTYEEFRLQGPDGAVIWVANASYPIMGEDGEVESVTGIARDITDKRRAGEILLKSKRDWEATFDAIPDCICIVDKAKTITRMNTAMAERLGGHPSRFVGRNYCSILCCGEDGSCCKGLVGLDHALEPCEIPIDALGGWFLVTSTPLVEAGGEDPRTVLVFRDITRRRTAESRYMDLFNSASSGIFQADRNGAFLQVNPALAAFLGHASPADCIRRSPPVAELFGNPSQGEEFGRMLDEKGEIVGFEAGLRRMDQEEIRVRINARTARREGQGELIEGFMEDVTEQRRVEQSLAQSQRLEAMGLLAGGIAHDFNNILGAIIGYTDLALSDAISEEKKAENLRNVLAAGRRARDLVRQILTFSRSDAQSACAVNIIPLIKETLRFLRSSLPPSVRIEHRLPRTASSVLITPSKFHQVIMNLCTNAVQAMQDKGGVLRVELDEVDEEGAGGPYVRLRVEDTGCGMEEDVRERIFEPYFTTKKVGEGTGMGLAVVHGIVRSHGGLMTVDSEPGEGTVFSILFPTAEGEAGRSDVAEPAEEEPGKGECILVVDDERNLVDILRQMLTSLGYKVLGAHSSPLALQLFQADPDMFDLVITDQSMPDMDGLELADRLAALKPGIPVLLCTGHGGTAAAGKGASSIRCVLDKPLEKSLLSRVLRQYLGEGEAGNVAEALP